MVGWGPRYGVIVVQPNNVQLEIIAKLIAQGKLKAVIDRVLPLQYAQ